MNTFGQRLRLTSFGESHGPAIGGVLDGFPAGVKVDFDLVRRALEARSPRGIAGATTRREADEPEFLSGIYRCVTLGTPIAFVICNTDARSSDYDDIADAYRPNHADYTYEAKYGIRDPRGGGRASARETAVRVVAGAFAEMMLAPMGVTVSAEVAETGNPADDTDTYGGIVQCTVSGLPAGIGEPVFGKLQSQLAAAMMSIPAVKGFDYGDGFAAAASTGKAQLDEFYADAPDNPHDRRIRTRTNHSGGIQGGISNGMPVTMRIALKPIATIPGLEVATVGSDGGQRNLRMKGRHDRSALPRAVAVVRAMALLTVADAIIQNAMP